MTTKPKTIIGVHSPLEAKMVHQLGGEFIWLSGYSISVSCFGLPDLDLSSPEEKFQIIKRIIEASNINSIIDLDAGIEDPDVFKDHLLNISKLNPSFICIEDEKTPKISALYKTERKLITQDEFVDRLNFTDSNSSSSIIARTNAIVRNYSEKNIEERIASIVKNTNIKYIALHGSDIEKIGRIIFKFPDLEFFLITSLLSEKDLEKSKELRLKGLIFGHDLVFCSTLAKAERVKQLIQTQEPFGKIKKASKLIDTLVEVDNIEIPIELEMKRYYDARAKEYEEWYDRINQYDKGEEQNKKWFSDLDKIETVLDKFNGENIIEIAAGTGRWTKILSKKNRILPTDVSNNMLSINYEKTKIKGDIFDVFSDIRAEYSYTFSMCFFAFWLSHIPRDRLDAFFNQILKTLKKNQGKVVMVDSYYNPEELNCLNHKNDMQLRALNSGEVYKVYKHYYTPLELEVLSKKHFSKWDIVLTKNYFFILTGYLD